MCLYVDLYLFTMFMSWSLFICFWSAFLEGSLVAKLVMLQNIMIGPTGSGEIRLPLGKCPNRRGVISGGCGIIWSDPPQSRTPETGRRRGFERNHHVPGSWVFGNRRSEGNFQPVTKKKRAQFTYTIHFTSKLKAYKFHSSHQPIDRSNPYQ